MTKMTRVLHLISSGGLYGAERVLLNIATGTQQAGLEPVIGMIVPPDAASNPLADAAGAAGISCRILVLHDGFRPFDVRATEAFLSEAEPDIVHSHGYRANILSALMPSRRIKWRRISTLHGWTATHAMSKLAIYEALEKQLLQRLDRLVLVCGSMRNKLPRGLQSAPLAVIPNGINVETSLERGRGGRDERPRPGGSAQALRILTVGRLAREKRFDSLLESCALILRRGHKVSVTIAGEGPDRERLEERTRELGIFDHVAMPGYVADVETLYQSADVFVLPSSTEGLPMVVLEAMLHGVPVVATDVGDIPEVLGHGQYGRLVQEESTDDFVERLARAILQSVWDPVDTAAARERVKGRYSRERMVSEYLSIYRELAPMRAVLASNE